MKIYIYTESAKEFYYLPIKKLKEEGKIQDYEIISMKIFRPVIKNLLISLGFAKNRSKTPLTIKEFFRALIAPIRLLFVDNIIVGMAPYDWRVFYPLILKLLGKNLVYHNSWPYWEGADQPKKALPGVKFAWSLFLKDTKAVGVIEQVSKQLKTFGAKSITIPHSVDTTKFRPQTRDKKNNKFVVLTVARLDPSKGIKELIQIFKEKEFQNFNLVISSEGGPLEKYVIREAKKNSNIKFVRFDKEEVAQLYRDSDIFVLNSYKVPGWEELFGMVIIEAMASGLPVISTDCIGPKSIIKNGITGFLIGQRDKDGLKEKISSLASDEKLRLTMYQRAWDYAASNYDVEIIARKWLDILTR